MGRGRGGADGGWLARGRQGSTGWLERERPRRVRGGGRQVQGKAKASGAGGGRMAFRQRAMERLELQLPHLPRAALEAHAAWMDAAAAFNSRKRDVAENWKRERATLLTWAKDRFSAARADAEQASERARELLAAEARADELRRQLESLRPAFEEKRARDEEARLEDERKRLEAAEAAAVLAMEAQKKKRSAVEKFHQERAASRAAQEAEERRAKAAAEAERQRQAEIDRSRVSYRDSKRTQKLDSIEQLRWQAAKKEAARLRAIAAIAASVPYAEAIAQAQSDLSKTTAAFDQAVFDAGKAVINNGFSDKKLFADPRFKLGYALHAAGVNSSAAAASAVQRACPTAPTPFASTPGVSYY